MRKHNTTRALAIPPHHPETDILDLSSKIRNEMHYRHVARPANNGQVWTVVERQVVGISQGDGRLSLAYISIFTIITSSNCEYDNLHRCTQDNALCHQTVIRIHIVLTLYQLVRNRVTRIFISIQGTTQKTKVKFRISETEVLGSGSEFNFLHHALPHARSKRSVPHTRRLKVDPLIYLCFQSLEYGYILALEPKLQVTSKPDKTRLTPLFIVANR
uniref:(California timema) hypothetical protein n=1 Tax=Timema californicum TaxID=61474 RepID=A0A7R9P329_TIMCA|nr:unnamed protein product [Timema californicum]